MDNTIIQAVLWELQNGKLNFDSESIRRRVEKMAYKEDVERLAKLIETTYRNGNPLL